MTDTVRLAPAPFETAVEVARFVAGLDVLVVAVALTGFLVLLALGLVLALTASTRRADARMAALDQTRRAAAHSLIVQAAERRSRG